jgi:hypothetical protein
MSIFPIETGLSIQEVAIVNVNRLAELAAATRAWPSRSDPQQTTDIASRGTWLQSQVESLLEGWTSNA